MYQGLCQSGSSWEQQKQTVNAIAGNSLLEKKPSSSHIHWKSGKTAEPAAEIKWEEGRPDPSQNVPQSQSGEDTARAAAELGPAGPTAATGFDTDLSPRGSCPTEARAALPAAVTPPYLPEVQIWHAGATEAGGLVQSERPSHRALGPANQVVIQSLGQLRPMGKAVSCACCSCK